MTGRTSNQAQDRDGGIAVAGGTFVWCSSRDGAFLRRLCDALARRGRQVLVDREETPLLLSI